jgi:glycosyltransferase involved in cell wall biosynthesis
VLAPGEGGTAGGGRPARRTPVAVTGRYDRVDCTLFVSWIDHHGRSADLCRVLPARCAFVGAGRVANPRTAPLRHLVQAVRTVRWLLRVRPRVLWVMAPPGDLVLLALLWRRLSGGRLVVDAHTGAVLDPGSGAPRSTRLLRRADLVVVTTPRLAAVLERRGVRALPLHDPPLQAVDADVEHGRVVLPASWYADEPWADVLDAARLLPDVRFVLTGRAPAGIVVPPNVRLSGYLPTEAYERLVAGAAVVLALTTREDTMQRAAYEAVAAGRPVVASGTRALREHLSRGAVFTIGGGEDLARAVREALDRSAALARDVVALREEHERAFEQDLTAVRSAIA